MAAAMISPAQREIITAAWEVMIDCRHAPWSREAIDQWFAVCEAMLVARMATDRLRKNP